MHPIQSGNFVLIGLGVLLILSGPYIIYKTVMGVLRRKNEGSKAPIQWFNDGLNLLVAVLFFIAGILFVVNNLRGNPLA